MDRELDKAPRCTQQMIVDYLPIGESYSLTHRLDLTYGIDAKARGTVAERLRGRLDQMTFKSRQGQRGKKFRTEVLYALAHGNAIYVICVCTRTN